jgi:hypothetical protein
MVEAKDDGEGFLDEVFGLIPDVDGQGPGLGK